MYRTALLYLGQVAVVNENLSTWLNKGEINLNDFVLDRGLGTRTTINVLTSHGKDTCVASLLLNYCALTH